MASDAVAVVLIAVIGLPELIQLVWVKLVVTAVDTSGSGAPAISA